MTRSRNPLGVRNSLLNYGMIEWQETVEDYHKTPQYDFGEYVEGFWLPYHYLAYTQHSFFFLVGAQGGPNFQGSQP